MVWFAGLKHYGLMVSGRLNSYCRRWVCLCSYSTGSRKLSTAGNYCQHVDIPCFPLRSWIGIPLLGVTDTMLFSARWCHVTTTATPAVSPSRRHVVSARRPTSAVTPTAQTPRRLCPQSYCHSRFPNSTSLHIICLHSRNYTSTR